MFLNLENFLSPENQKIFSIIPAGVCIADAAGKIKFWNRGAEIITGYDFEDIKGKPMFDLIDPESYISNTVYTDLKRPEKSRLGDLINHKHKLGGLVTIEYHKNPIYNVNNKLIGTISLFHDKTGEVLKLKSQQKFYKSISEYLSFQTIQNIYSSIRFGQDEAQLEKELTVAFIDIVNYTQLCEQHPEDSIIHLLNVFYDKTASFIRTYKGSVDKFIGDCVLGYFENPNNCLKATKDILGEGLFSLNKKLEYLNLPTITYRIGIDTGKVIIGNIGGLDHKEFTIIGDVVNTASRVQGIAKPRSIMLTEKTYSLITNKRGISYFDEVKLRGKNRPIKLYSLTYKADHK